MQLLGGGGAGLTDLGFSVEGGRLMGVLAVAEALDFAVAKGFRFAEHGRFRSHGVGKEVRDKAVVVSGRGEDLLGAGAVELEGGFSFVLVHDLKEFVVVGGVGDDRHVLEVLGGGTEHGRAADVDVFYRFRESHVWLLDGGLEGIEIDDDKVDILEGVFLHGLLMGGIVAHGEKTGVDLRMERFDAAVQHFRETGEFVDGLDGDAFPFEEFGGAAGGNYLHAAFRELHGQFRDSRFVGNGNKSSFNLFHFEGPVKLGCFALILL